MSPNLQHCKLNKQTNNQTNKKSNKQRQTFVGVVVEVVDGGNTGTLHSKPISQDVVGNSSSHILAEQLNLVHQTPRSEPHSCL
jgi:hypothetical protein